MSEEGSDVVSKSKRLDRSAISITVACVVVAAAASGGFWLRDREASKDERMLLRLNEVERVFAERANLAAASARQEAADLRLLIEKTEARILAAIQNAGERVSFLERDIKSWVELLDAQNTITVPAFGKR